MHLRLARSRLLPHSILPSPCFSRCARLPRSARPRPTSPQPTRTARSHSLDQYHGKYVVLEWHNQGCPYTRKHYESGNMQNLQKEWTAKGVVWFTVISSAPGEQGYVTADRGECLSGEDARRAHRGAAGSRGQSSAVSTTPRPRRRCTSSIRRAS